MNQSKPTKQGEREIDKSGDFCIDYHWGKIYSHNHLIGEFRKWHPKKLEKAFTAHTQARVEEVLSKIWLHRKPPIKGQTEVENAIDYGYNQACDDLLRLKSALATEKEDK